MPTRRFDNSNPATFPQSLYRSLEMSNYAAPPMQLRVVDEVNISPEAEWPDESSLVEPYLDESYIDRRKLGRGVRWAFAIEGSAALFIYTIWYLWHLWR